VDDHRNCHHDPSFDYDRDKDEEIVQPVDTLYLEQMPSFVFVNDDDYEVVGEDNDGPPYSDKPDPDGTLKYSNYD
jgi:hypothetical protein